MKTNTRYAYLTIHYVMLVVISLSMMVLIIWAELESSGLTTCAWFSRPTAFSVRYFST